MENNFIAFLTDLMIKKGWNQVELAQRSKLSQGAISKVLSAQRKPGPEFCESIAKAFKIPLIDVFTAAGFNIQVKTQKENKELNEINQLISMLPPEKQQSIREIAESYLAKIDQDERTAAMKNGLSQHT